MALLIAVYTTCTLATMVGMVVSGYYGLRFIRTDKLERYIHALGGLTLFVCGAGMVFMGW
jgi:hypothetical protein